jgi:hypothetical protein
MRSRITRKEANIAALRKSKVSIRIICATIFTKKTEPPATRAK